MKGKQERLRPATSRWIVHHTTDRSFYAGIRVRRTRHLYRFGKKE